MSSLVDDILNRDTNEEDDFYDILGCSEHSTEEQINTEYKSRVLSCHPDKHPDDSEAAKRFAKLQKAKEVLGNSETREKYDKWRRSGIAMSYDQWCGLKDSVHTSMHWACKKPQPMIGGDTAGKAMTSGEKQPSPYPKPSNSDQRKSYGSEGRQEQSPSKQWAREPPSEMLRKFRNYEI